MAAAIGLRDDFDGPDLRVLAKATKDAAQGRRLLALAEIYDGGRRSDAARIGGVCSGTVKRGQEPISLSRINYVICPKVAL